MKHLHSARRSLEYLLLKSLLVRLVLSIWSNSLALSMVISLI